MTTLYPELMEKVADEGGKPIWTTSPKSQKILDANRRWYLRQLRSKASGEKGILAKLRKLRHLEIPPPTGKGVAAAVGGGALLGVGLLEALRRKIKRERGRDALEKIYKMHLLTKGQGGPRKLAS